jgi:hypothetical protein
MEIVMNIKKVLLLLVLILTLTGCTNINDLNYDEIVENFALKEKTPNTYRKGYKFYVPKGLSIKNAGVNYAVIVNNDTTFYTYFDLISLREDKEIVHNVDSNSTYDKKIINGDKKGYLSIKIAENNQYLIEIMYNYAKIELMVDEGKIKESLCYAINILNSVKYDMTVIDNLLKEDDLDSAEEVYDMFNKVKKPNETLDYSNENDEELEEKVIKDTDYVD